MPEDVSSMRVLKQLQKGPLSQLKPRALLLPPPPRLGVSSAGAATLRRCPSRRRRKRRPEFPHQERPWLDASEARGWERRCTLPGSSARRPAGRRSVSTRLACLSWSVVVPPNSCSPNGVQTR
ncbi:hypothetical protein AALO_G00111460 [Alosa alosa]|uniref:Uncharacterized protein n=1 Tax=Alosa alosa TaxID=278164 RepID=A0AAV6GTH7_9TELE|nr:hypothetical protein AALO_G00111460 [Alosa alosa]